MDAEPVQACLRELLTDVGRGAHYAPHCDDVGHLSAHTGNTNNNGMFEFVHSDDESDILVRIAILRGVWSDDDWANASASKRQRDAARVDKLPVQNRVWHLHVGVGGGAD